MDLFESTKDKLKRTLGGLYNKYNYEIDHNTIKIWTKTRAFNITKVTIDALKEINYKLFIVTLSNDKTKLFNGETTYKPMLIFKEVQ